ncbi:GMC family oxidoreductase N-terminal domain-containing protein [Tabrizicola sp. J26]|uniref:GMC family oxidoreductase n=1 Tax=Alitabrizicola rongguiensis TaxID=2909234 RepID=UPI001F1E6DC0|nr:GMC family oxidoreductase N-terminal domain-containing protein [Tabrizicola rongguiensis]MCF1711124.1 GMC family oxidoreductase N-terminal domain-containing protein [Tabrizicola rongguiensis]
MTYDYVIAGGGSSGSLVAGKLAEAGAKVLVLEAGGSDRNPLIQMPAGFVKLLGVEKYMWFYQSEVQQRLGGRQPVVPTGRVIGGGSSVNAMVYIRGQAGDYLPWVEATGDDGWGWPELLKRFKAMEGNNRFNNELHGTDGPWSVSDPIHICELSRAYVMAAQAAGLPFTPDFNGPRQSGTGFFQLTTKDGRRVSAADAFLHPAMKTGRISVLTGCLVHRLLIENGRAVGVEYSRDNKIETARAAKEVVMCAGAIATPKILMLSGIGPHFHLKEMGIKTIVDHEGIGKNLQDHTEVPVLAFCNGPYGYFGQDRGWNQIRNGLQYMMFRTGPVASNGVEACSFFDPDDLSNEAKIQQFCVPSVYLEPGTTDLKPSWGITLNSCVLRPGSKGSVRLNSADPRQQPLVDPNYFEDPEDLRLSIGGVRQARRILAQEPIRRMIDREIFPGPEKDTDEALAEHAKRFVKTVYHPVGTVRMGRDNDPLAVVTPDLRLKGVDGLRVADASVMPTIISGNTNSTTLVIADRAVSFMLSANGK